MTVNTFSALVDPLIAMSSGEPAALDVLADAMGCDSLGSDAPSPEMSAEWRKILISLPLDERSFNDAVPKARFSPFVAGLGSWWTAEKQRRSAADDQRHDTLLGFVGLLVLTLLSLAESDR